MKIKRLKDSLKPLSGILIISVLASMFFILASFNRYTENEIEHAESFMNLVVSEMHAVSSDYYDAIGILFNIGYFDQVVEELDAEETLSDETYKQTLSYLSKYYSGIDSIEAVYINHEDKGYVNQFVIKGIKAPLTIIGQSDLWKEYSDRYSKISVVSIGDQIKVLMEYPHLKSNKPSGYNIAIQVNFEDLFAEHYNQYDYSIVFVSKSGVELTNFDSTIITELKETYGNDVFGEFKSFNREKASYVIEDVNYFNKHIIVSAPVNDVFNIVLTKPYNKYNILAVQEYLVSHLVVFILMMFAVVGTINYSNQRTKQWVDNEKQFLNEIIDMDKIQISELKKELRFHLDFFEESAIPLLIIDKESLRIMTVNNQAVKFYQYQEDELLEMYFSDICKWNSDNPATEIISVHHMKKDKSVEEKRIRVQEVAFNDSELMVIMIIEGLAADDSMMNELKVEMFHEIRSPLQGAYGAVEMIEKASDAHADYTSIIKRSLTNVLMMTNNVLAEGKLSSNQDKVFESEFDLVKLVNEVVDSTVFQDKHYNLISGNVQENISDVLNELNHYYVKTDPIKLRQILINLMSNGSKYTEDGMINLSVEVSREKDKDILIFRISDTGIGLTKVQISQMYDAFKTFTTGHDISSTGIGLAITKKYVELLGSNLHVSSEPGLGTTFSFSLEVEPTTAKKIINTETKSILVVDDDVISCEYLTHLLENELNCFVKTLTNETQIFSELTHHEYSCLIIDQNLNHFKGVDMIKLIRTSVNKRISEIPIVLITASKTKHEFRKISEAKLDDIILKPFENDEVVSALKTLLEKEIEYEMTICKFINKDIIESELICETIETVGRDVFVELVNKFKVNSLEDLKVMKTMSIIDESEQIKSMLHRLKGSMSYFAPSVCKTLIQNLEVLALNKDLDFNEKLNDFSYAHEELLKELQMICRNL